jgi:hypothetical protein
MIEIRHVRRSAGDRGETRMTLPLSEIDEWLVANSDSDDPQIVMAVQIVRELLATQEWQPIATAPRDGTGIIGNYGPNFVALMEWSKKSKTWTDGSFFYQPTHWRPLPAPPSDVT